MLKKPQIYGAILVLVGLALVTGWWFKLWPTRRAQVMPPAKALVARWAGAQGITWKYDLDLTMDADLAGSRILGLHLRGRLAMASSESEGARVMRIQVEQPQLEQVGSNTDEFAPTINSIQPQLAESFMCEVGPSGDVRVVMLRSGIDPLVSRLLRTVLVESQVVVPEDRTSGDSWETDESDLTGTFRGTYTWQPARRTLSKAKKRFVRVNPGVGLGIRTNQVKITKSDGQALLNTSGSITDLEYTEDLAMRIDSGDGQPFQARSTTRLSIKNGVAVADSPILLAAVSRTTKPAYAEEPPQSHTEATDNQRIGGRKLPDILLALRNIDRSTTKGKQDLARLYVATTALMRRNPDALVQAKAVINRGGKDAAFMIAALGDAGTEKSASALTELLKTNQDSTLKRSALQAMGRTTYADQAALDAVQALYNDKHLGGLARLMAGAMAYNSRASAPSVGVAAVDGLVQSLKGETRRLYVVDDLRALGNSGDTQAAEVAVQYASSSDPMIRAAAAQAARRTNTPQGAEVMVRLITDPDSSVRSSALTAALYSQPSSPLISAVEQAARVDSEDSLRREAVRVLTSWKFKDPAVRATLAWVSTNDPNDKIRAVAREGLNRFD